MGACTLVLLAATAGAHAQEQMSQHMNQQLTPCQRCCAPGGDCSHAFKGTPGKCCGSIDGRAFCCPGILDGAKCYNCDFGYRCFTGISARNICGGHSHVRSAQYGPRHDYPNGDESSTGMVLILGVTVVLSVIFCARRQHDYTDPYYGVPMGKPHVAYGQPMPPCCGPPMPMHPYGACGGGYSGTAVAGSAAAGFLGGMLVSDAMNAHHHHHHTSDYGGVGYADAGGGGYDGGGGDCGFASDS